MLEQIRTGVRSKRGDILRAARARVLRTAGATTWLEVVLDEGKNRQIRRLFEALGVNVLRLIRVAIGRLKLGNLETAKTRPLTAAEIQQLSSPQRTRRPQSDSR
jgi:23S rRNA pseudouridine2605 synthase